MRRVILTLTLVCLLAPPVFADIVEVVAAERYAGDIALGTGGAHQRFVGITYSNTTTVTAGYSRLNPPPAEIGDELLMIDSGELDSVQFSVYNSTSSAGILQTADLALKFYNFDGVSSYILAGTLSWDNVDFGVGGLGLGYYTTLSVGGIAAGNDINLTDTVLATLTISDLTGGSNRVGQVLANPPSIGSSTDDFFRDGAWYWFGGVPVANFYWEIGVIPEPATLAMLGLGALALIRRRR